MADKDLSENPVRELIRRFLITFLLGVVVYRLGALVPIPGVNAEVLKSIVYGEGEASALGAIIRYADMFNGGAIQNASIFGLGITPYISASIILQLLAFSIPALKAMQKEGETGRRRINQFTRYATLVIALVQSVIAAVALVNYTGPSGQVLVQAPNVMWFVIQSMLVITTGCMLILWISEQITKFGIGNGVSVVIMIGILSVLPQAFHGFGNELPPYLLVAAVTLGLIAAIVVVVQAVRRIHLEQQRRVQGNKVYGGAQTTLPLKLNQANVIPVIFASPILIGLDMVSRWIASGAGVDLSALFAYGTPGHRYIFIGLIVAFTYFYIGITFDLFDLSNHFKQAGFFVRGIKPGRSTVDYLQTILNRITFVGAIFLALIATMPEMIGGFFGIGGQGGRVLLGGTGLLIVVGVSLDIMQKVSGFFLASQYGGMGDGSMTSGNKKPGKRF